MNLVDVIKNQFSDGAVHQLSTLLGAGESTTRNAIEAAVPALLSGLSSVASNPKGAQKLASALGKFDGATPSNLGNGLADDPGSQLEEGSALLSSLMGGNMLTAITNAVARFAGLGAGMVQKLLGYLMPMVLGSVAGRLAGRSLNPQSLAKMLGEQKASIASALPSGFSLADVPGLGAVGAAAQAGAHTAQKAGASAMKWLLPIGGLAILGLVLWALFRPSTPPTLALPNVGVPDVAQVSTDLSSNFNALGQSLAGIKDAASAAAALPKLEELKGKLADLKSLADRLPAAGKTKIHDLVEANLGKLDDQFAKLLWVPGVGEKIKPVVDGVMERYSALGGLPAPQVSTVSGELASAISSLTSTLTGIKDAATAEAALPKLKDLNDKLDAPKKALAGLPESAKSSISALIRSAVNTVQALANKVLANTGASEKVKPVVDSIMGKLTALAG
jgi:hypothetical protein